MNHHGYGSDDRQFEDFRKKKSRQIRQRRLAEGQSGLYSHGYQNVAQRDVESNDQREAHDMQLRREMDEFVRDTTKLAAGVLCEVHEQKDREIEQQVTHEMSDFFDGELADPHDPGDALPHEEPAGFRPVSQHQRQMLSLQEHMQYQGELGAEATQEDLARLVSEQQRRSAAPAQGHESAAAYVANAEPTPVPQDVGAPRLQFPATVDEHAAEEDDYTEFRGEALSDFCDLDDDVRQYDDDDEAALEDSVREFERISHLEPDCGDEALEDEDEAAADGPPRPQGSVPKAFASLLLDPDRCKATLTCLANGGVLDRDAARAIYAEMKERWSHCFDA